MIAGHRLPLLAWYVVGLLLRCRCYSIGHAFFSSTTSSNSVGLGHVPHTRARRFYCHFRQGSNVGRGRATVGACSEGVGGAAVVLSRRIEKIFLPPGRGLRIHALSDLHTDSKANLAWVQSWASWKGYEAGDLGEAHEDVLIVAGDISSSLERSAETLECLMKRYDEVFFVVGNHEMWTSRQKSKTEEGGGGGLEVMGSVEKLVQMHSMCESLGVRTDPVIFVVGGEGGGASGAAAERWGGDKAGGWQELAVFPLLSWYHASWDDEPDLPPELQLRRGDFLRRWRDYSYCHWPDDLCKHEDFVTVDRDAPPLIAEFFARQNDGCIQAFQSTRTLTLTPATAAGAPPIDDGVEREDANEEEGAGGVVAESSRLMSTSPRGASSSRGGGGAGGRNSTTKVISFSHFVPRQELCPEKRLLWEPQLPKVIGSAPLERQIRELGSDVHIFGHTHIPIDMTSDGVRYVQWPLGNQREQLYRTTDMRQQGPLLVYSHDGHEGGLRPPVHTLWGEFYEAQPRDPHNTEIPENPYEYMKKIIADGRRRRAKASDVLPEE